MRSVQSIPEFSLSSNRKVVCDFCREYARISFICEARVCGLSTRSEYVPCHGDFPNEKRVSVHYSTCAVYTY